MVLKFFVPLFLTLITFGPAIADDHYFIIADSSPQELLGFDGRYWGIEDNKVLLSGGQLQLRWLNQRHIDNIAARFDGEPSILYLWYIDSGQRGPVPSLVIFRHDNFLISTAMPGDDVRYRRLKHRPLPQSGRRGDPAMILTYDPLIDEIIGRVNQDTILDYLSRLSGASPIEFDGQLDTIHTRYSGTDDNYLAAGFLRQTLEDYGYQSEFHGFYGGSIRHMTSFDENLAWIVTENSEALRTIDGGANWLIMPDGTDNSLWGIANWGADLVWIAGNSGTIRFSDNGGQSFTGQNSGVGSFLFGITFISESEGWVAGDFGDILHTTNGGQNWTAQSTPTSSRLYDICFVDSQNGWACGRDGAVIHTTDGGANWTAQNANTSQRLYGIEFTDSQNGWLVGWGGVVRHTVNGGAAWQTVNLGSNVEKYHVEFADSMFGCIAGWNGEIFITADGGSNWAQRSSGSQGDFYGLTLVDSQTGYVGGNGILLKTINGGDTWFSQVQNIESAWQNVVATKPGTVSPDEQVIICAHMDNRSETPYSNAPGADDNGSGSIAVLEAARVFAQYDFEKTIKFCLWTGEEQGLLGSAVYAEEAFARGDNIIGVYNFDMIAWDGNADGSAEFHTGTAAPSIALGNALVEVVNDYDIVLDPDIITWGATGASDHASFWDYNYAAMLGIEDYSGDFNPYYHTTGDNMDHIMEGFFTEFTKAAVGGAATLAVLDTAITSVDDFGTLPGGFALHHNYPNPFNAATTISFAVPTETEIDLAVYDIMGRRVTILYSGPVNAGTHRITWNADDRPSGVYFYRLTAGDSETTGRMTLLK